MKKKGICYVMLSVLTAMIIVIVGNIWASSNWLKVNSYGFKTEKTQSELKMVVLSDLHNHEFGKNNKKLIEKVAEQEPDLIFLVGDFLNEDSEDSSVMCELVQGLSEFAPVYFALGNHEEAYMQKNGTGLLEELEAAGAKVLEEEYEDIEIKGTALRLGGMYEYAFGSDSEHGENVGAAVPEETGRFLREFQDTDRLKIMMAHRPDSFIFGDAASYWEIDLVLSGHNHGGQVVVPFKGGLYGGDQGWFPTYIHGMYEKDGMSLFVTSGLGSNRQKLPRFNNRPEIAVITLKEH